MNNFKGYLLKAVKTGQLFPAQYIDAGSWYSIPSQREEIKAYRDENTRNMTRITAAGRKSLWSFSTLEGIHLEEKMEIQKFFTDNENDADQRRITLEFWNDETNSYQTGDFYRPNMNFPIKEYTQTDIIYKALKIEGVEY